MEQYIIYCRAERSDAEKKDDKKSLFPNLAGFCRFVGIGIGELEDICTPYPELFDKLLTVLEDEALNSGLSATLLSAYLKKRLGYDVAHGHTDAGATQMQIHFEHNIFEDGE